MKKRRLRQNIISTKIPVNCWMFSRYVHTKECFLLGRWWDALAEKMLSRTGSLSAFFKITLLSLSVLKQNTPGCLFSTVVSSLFFPVVGFRLEDLSFSFYLSSFLKCRFIQIFSVFYANLNTHINLFCVVFRYTLRKQKPAYAF